MLKKNDITYERLHKLLEYNKCTGIFNWKIYRNYNAKVGEIAGYQRPDGYTIIGVDGSLLLAHRLAWLYVHGYMPENGLDHKNQIKDDNRINNLREVSNSCNIRNSKMFCNNKSGVKGVCWHKRDKKWTAKIEINNKTIHLGCFSTKLGAAKVRHDAEIKYNWSSCNTKKSSAFAYIQEHGGLN